METMLAQVRAADKATLYSLYFPDHGHVKAAAVAGCVCVDELTCTECERILGVSFHAIVLPARKKQRRDPPVPVARLDSRPGQGVWPGSHGLEGSGAAISSMPDQLGLASHPLSNGVEEFDAAISGTVDRLMVEVVEVDSHPSSYGIEGSDATISDVVGSHPPSDGVGGSDAAISGTADRLMVDSHPPSDGIEGSESDAPISGTAALLVDDSEASISSRADRPGQGSHPPSDGIKGSDTAISSIADQLEPGLNGRVEGFEAAISGMAALLVPVSHPPLDGVEESEAAISGTTDRLVPGSQPPSDGVEGSDAAISDTADRLELRSPPPSDSDRGFEAAISRMAARVGLAAAVGERAKEVFRKMEEARAELALATADGGGGAAVASRRDIARLVAHIRRRLGEEAGQAAGIGMASVSSFTRRFGTLVGLEESELTVALEAARRLDEGVLDVRHKVDSLAAAVVCLTLERAGAKRPGFNDVEAATGISDTTIYSVCKKLRDHGDLLFC
ncbi:unnamed protein product [Alopecurus aequalis]